MRVFPLADVLLAGTVTVPDVPIYPEYFQEDFTNGIGNWTTPDSIGGPREVVAGVFRSWDWSYDQNHLTTKGGPGMLHLMAYADYQYWNYQNPDGTWVLSNFTNADINMRVRGVSFVPNGSEWIVWITARHPTFPGEIVNWGYIAEPRTSALTAGTWQDVHWRLDPDPAKWVLGKGADGGIYDTPLDLPTSLQNICNIHWPMLGPDNVAHPGGSFELDRCTIAFNRNGVQDVAGLIWNPLLNFASSPNSGLSFRGVTTPSPIGGTQIRAIVKGHPTLGSSLAHAAVGKRSTGINTVTAPMEFIFNGVVGVTAGAGVQVASDWMDFAVVQGDVHVTVADCSSDGQARTDNGTMSQYRTGASYNQAVPGGAWASTQYIGFKLEVR